jgi:hypothetical protein
MDKQGIDEIGGPELVLAHHGPQGWRAPQPVAAWSGVREAKTYGNACLQPPPRTPADALPAGGPKAGGLVIGVQPRLSGALPGLRRFFETYPFSCLEQKASQAIGLQDKARWSALVNALPTYLDRDGLAAFFPLREGDRPGGSDRLTAYLLQAAHRAIASGVPVVRASRCLLGGVFGAPRDALPSYGTLTPWQARIELMLDLL